MLRIATFNIQYAERDRWLIKREGLKKRIERMGVDILCMQEVSAEGVAYLRDELGAVDAVASGREDGMHLGEHLPILILRAGVHISRSGTFWLSPTPELPSKGWGARCKRICTWIEVGHSDFDAPLHLLNLHLDHGSKRAREKSVELLRQRLGSFPAPGRAILTGDFNFRPSSRIYGKLIADGLLHDACTGPSIDERPGQRQPTWDGITRFGWGRARLDYFFHTSGICVRQYQVLDNTCLGVRLSDHRPVLVEVETTASSQKILA